jgi:hypothetical protein
MMWSARYRQGESSDGFQMSPCLTASSGLLTPPSNYSIDGRRGSTASTLSSLGPSTPVYARNPFSDHRYPNVATIEQCQDQSMETLSIGYPFKASGSEDASYDDTWTSLSHSDGLDHAMPMRMQHSFVTHPGLVQSPMATYNGIDHQTSSAPVSCTSSFSSAPYTDFGSSMDSDADNAHTTEPIWSYQYALTDMMAPTMAPTESMLGSEYVQVGTMNSDTDMSHYDDVDMPLVPTPQDVVVKQEDPESSVDDRKVTRSIWVSSTGGKSVKKEELAMSEKKRKASKARKSRDKSRTTLLGYRFDIDLDDDVVQIPGTKKWKRNGGGPSKAPHICEMETAGAQCGRKFRRQEHLHRHEKTHSGRKDYSCQLCPNKFNRNDNCWAHYWTHVHRPGKKDGRNIKYSLRRVLTYISDPKLTEKLLTVWLREVGYEYDASKDVRSIEEELAENTDASPASAADSDRQMSSTLKHDACKIRSKL